MRSNDSMNEVAPFDYSKETEEMEAFRKELIMALQPDPAASGPTPPPFPPPPALWRGKRKNPRQPACPPPPPHCLQKVFDKKVLAKKGSQKKGKLLAAPPLPPAPPFPPKGKKDSKEQDMCSVAVPAKGSIVESLLLEYMSEQRDVEMNDDPDNTSTDPQKRRGCKMRAGRKIQKQRMEALLDSIVRESGDRADVARVLAKH